MSQHIKLLQQLLALSGESFEDELRRLGFSTTQLTPLEVLTAIQHAQLRLNREFTKEEFMKGEVGGFMLPEDFEPEQTQERLLRARKDRFNKQLEQLAEPLGSLVDKHGEEYAEIPKDDKIFDIQEAINLDTSKLETETTGERIVKQIQEWLLTKVGSKETAVLPEDKMQRLLVGACNQLELSCHIEMSACQLRLDAVRMIKTVLAGTATKQFTDVMEAVFGGEEDKAVREAMEAEEGLSPEEEEEDEAPVQETGEPSTSSLPKALKRKGPPLTGKSKKPTLGAKKYPAICAIEEAKVIYPSTSDQEKHLHAGVESRFISSRKSSAISQRAGYGCIYSEAMRSDGIIVEDCDFISSTKSQLSTHIRRSHLGAAVVCYVCDERWWGASTWFEHMEKMHPSLQKEDYFIKEGSDVAELRSALTIKKEVSPEEI